MAILNMIKKNLSILVWGIAGFIIMVAVVWIFDGWQGLWGTILEPGLSGGTIGALARAFVFTEKEKKKAYAKKATNNDYVLIVKVSRPVVQAMKSVLGAGIEPDDIVDAQVLLGRSDLTDSDMKKMVVEAVRLINQHQHCKIHLFLQGPQYLGFHIGKLTGLSFDLTFYTYNPVTGNYECGEQSDRTWMIH